MNRNTKKITRTHSLIGITHGNVDDRDEKVIRYLTKEMWGKLFQELWEKNIQLITKVKKNMKNKLMDYRDKLLLRKQAFIESVNNFL